MIALAFLTPAFGWWLMSLVGSWFGIPFGMDEEITAEKRLPKWALTAFSWQRFAFEPIYWLVIAVFMILLAALRSAIG